MGRLLRLGVKLGFLAIGLVVIYFLFTFAQVWNASRTDDAQQAEAIVVLGAAQYNGVPSPVLKTRLDHAADLYDQGLAPVVALTGGRRPGDRATEASASAGYLISAGVPESALRLETSGTNSWQSLAAAARFLQDEGIEEVILVSSPYHALRTERIAEEVGLVGHASPAMDSSGNRVVELARMGREAVVVGLGRIIGYRRLVNFDERVGQVRTDYGAR